MVSTHSRPKAADQLPMSYVCMAVVSTHSRPKAAAIRFINKVAANLFQHTAARRRLP